MNMVLTFTTGKFIEARGVPLESIEAIFAFVWEGKLDDMFVIHYGKGDKGTMIFSRKDVSTFSYEEE